MTLGDRDTAQTCQKCGEPSPEGARYCPGCGSPLVDPARTIEMLPEPEPPSQDTIELRARRPVEFAPELHVTHRRPLGIEPLPLGAGLALAGLIVTIVLFATGGWIGAIVCLGLTIGLLTLVVAAIRREPQSRAARWLAAAGDRMASWGRFLAVGSRSGLHAAIELSRLRERRRRLRRRLDGQLRPLGGAVLREDARLADTLKGQAAEIELELKEAERQAGAVVEAARRRLGRERATLQPTQAFRAVEDPALDADSAPTD